MRLYEIDKQISEDMICEGLMDSIRQYVGDKVTNAVSVVNNTASAMIVIYKVASNPEYLDTITFLLKKAIKQKMKALGSNPIIQKLMMAVRKVFPTGRGITDFIKAIFLVSILNVLGMAAAKAKDWIKSQVEDGIKQFLSVAANKVVSLDAIVGAMTNANGIFGLLSALGIANEVLFEILDYMNKKIVNAPGQRTITA